MQRGSVRWRALVLDLWPALLAVLLCLPLFLASGYPLARDLVFVPHQAWTEASVGLGGAAPRAVPLDAVVALLSRVLDGAVLARIVLPLILAVAGWGAHRLVRRLGTVARLVAGGFAVWNPYVVERLALGQWALLAGYAALPWLMIAAGRYRAEGERRDLARTAAWLALASLTPTGGVLGSLAVLTAGFTRSVRLVWLLLVCVALQLPWLVPSLVGSAAGTSDPAGVDAFSAGAEGPGGVLVALLGLGGIWDANSVPATRNTWWATIGAAVIVAAVLFGWRRLPRGPERADAVRLAAFAATGFALALVSSIPWGGDLVRWLVTTVPGAGLLRDSQKFLAPAVYLAAVALAASAHLAVRWLSRRHGVELALTAALLAVATPFLLLPDATVSVWPTLEPVHYPAGFDKVAAILDDRGGSAALATLPWRSYRGFRWGNGLVSADPATRWFDRDVVVSDDLQVGHLTVRGEDLRARAIRRALHSGTVASALAANGVGWALVYRDDPAADKLSLAGLSKVYSDRYLALYRVPGPLRPGADEGRGRELAVAAADSLALVVLAGAVFTLVGRRRKRTGEPSG